MEKVCISKGNIKMGNINSVSLPPLTTCSSDAVKCCGKLCYAVRMARRLPNIMQSYDRNFKILQENPDKYWREVEAAIMGSTVFRWHVSGDIVDMDYLEHMVEIAKRNSHCEMIAFTKKFSIVNVWLNKNKELPSNLHIIYSYWKGLLVDNPFYMPECHIIYKDGTTTAKDGKAYHCTGNCFECFKCKRNCFSLKNGDQILIHQH